MPKDIIVRKKQEARNFMEGSEYCREYFSTGKITFGTSVLHPGQKGEIDKGHKEAEEVFFVIQGRVLVHFPDSGEYYELAEGDAILVPPARPHMLINIGESIAYLSWSCAPKP